MILHLRECECTKIVRDFEEFWGDDWTMVMMQLEGEVIKVFYDKDTRYVLAEDVLAIYYNAAPLEKILKPKEYIIDRAYFGEYKVVLTNQDRLLCIFQFFGDSDFALIEHAAVDFQWLIKNDESCIEAVKSWLKRLECTKFFRPESDNLIIQKLYDLIDQSEGEFYEEALKMHFKNKVKKEKAEYVYFIEAKDVGLIKIGFTSDFKSRLSTLSTSSPCMLEPVLVVRCDDGKNTEAYLHDLFSEKRKHGEWFKLSHNDINLASEYLTSIGGTIENLCDIN